MPVVTHGGFFLISSPSVTKTCFRGKPHPTSCGWWLILHASFHCEILIPAASLDIFQGTCYSNVKMSFSRMTWVSLSVCNDLAVASVRGIHQLFFLIQANRGLEGLSKFHIFQCEGKVLVRNLQANVLLGSSFKFTPILSVCRLPGVAFFPKIFANPFSPASTRLCIPHIACQRTNVIHGGIHNALL